MTSVPSKGILGGINAVIVGNYLTTLGRPAEDDLDLLVDLSMPIKTLNDTLSVEPADGWRGARGGDSRVADMVDTPRRRRTVPSGPSAPPRSSTSRAARRAVQIRCLHRDRTGIAVTRRDPPAARLGLEPPRFCGQCGRRMVVQVRPDGWSARCSRHGSVDSTEMYHR